MDTPLAFANLSRPNRLPIVNVVGVLVPEGDSAAVAPAGAAAP